MKKSIFALFLFIFLTSCTDNTDRTQEIIDEYKKLNDCKPTFFEEKVKPWDICGRYSCNTTSYKYTIVTYKCADGNTFTEELTRSNLGSTPKTSEATVSDN